MSSQKVKITLEKGEAYMIASIEFWEHLIATYKILAEEQGLKDQAYWLDAAGFISQWVTATQNIDPDPEDDEWQ